MKAVIATRKYKMNYTIKILSPEISQDLIKIMKERFDKNTIRQEGLEWLNVEERSEANPEKLCSLNEMEKTGGEPDVVGFDRQTGEYNFYDC